MSTPTRNHHKVTCLTVRASSTIAVAVFGLAGLLKAVDVYEFSRLLTLWTVIPRPLAPVLAVLIPMLEVGLATAWFARVGRRTASLGIIVVLLLFSLGATWQFVAHKPIHCGCFGGGATETANMSDLGVLLVRNSIMCVALILSLVLSRQVRKAPVYKAGAVV